MLILALRSLQGHKLQSAMVGGIIFFGTTLVVVGTSLLETVNRSMAQSVTSSIAGHIQVYSSEARDKLALFGSGFFGTDDVGEIPNFAPVRAALEQVPNVRAVVPMGMLITTAGGGNDIDRLLGRLRQSILRGNAAQIDNTWAQVRRIADSLLAANPSAAGAPNQVVTRITNAKFREELTAHPQEALEFLETHLAPLADDGRIIYLRNMGVDLPRFTALFDRFEMVSGTQVPKGARGFLFAERTYERFFKNRIARQLDEINTAKNYGGKTLADDAALREQAARLPGQYQRITFSLDDAQLPAVRDALGQLLEQPAADIAVLVQAFLKLDDDNFAERYAFFYQHIAPHIELYTVKIGEPITLRSFTKSGYLRSANVKVYGTFHFKGLESSELAGAENLLDMETFRELYGYMTQANRSELEVLRQQLDLADTARNEAESELFDQPSIVAQPLQQVSAEAPPTVSPVSELPTAVDANEGLALSAAVLLRDPSQLRQTQAAIEALSKKADLHLQTLDWQSAAGIVGQLIFVLRLVLYVAIFIIFLVALVIINNAMVLATMERVTEIGTMRAIGAQRNFILGAFLMEILILGMAAGCLGALAGALIIAALGHVGIPAINDIMVFLFSGPRLYPKLAVENLGVGMGIIWAVSLLSALYPARIATRISPVVAMQAKE